MALPDQILKVLDAVVWTPEANGSGYLHACGDSFGYTIDIEVSPDGQRWCVTLLNQREIGSSGDLDSAKREALTFTAWAILDWAMRC